MHTFFFLLMALIQVVFLLLTLRQLKHNRSVCTGIIIVLVFFGLFYDNLGLLYPTARYVRHCCRRQLRNQMG